MDFWTRLDAVRARNDVLTHSFYERWSRGELTRDELAVYAGEYHHAVVGLARASAAAASLEPTPGLRDELATHAAQETAHIDLWADFTAAVGGVPAAEPAPETVACASEWAGDGGRDLLHTLVALYAIEAGQPAISATKAAGLRDFYGLADGPATAYFTLHAQLDHEHAAAGRALIEPRLQDADEDALLATAERVLRANWQLLDGVERLNGR